MTSSDNSKFVAPHDPKARSFDAPKPSLAWAWWYIGGINVGEMNMYYGWVRPHSAGEHVVIMAITMGMIYAIRWTFRQ